MPDICDNRLPCPQPIQQRAKDQSSITFTGNKYTGLNQT